MNKERPILSNLINDNTTEVETFQNLSIRPVIKMQHHLLIAFFQNYVKKRKVDFLNLSYEKKKRIIKSALEKDIAFKNKMLGCILGHFSIEEYEIYSKKTSEYNKRIKQIIIKRLQDSIDTIN